MQVSGYRDSQASHACIHCRALKRKCSRDLPACTLCARLGKNCSYSLQNSASDIPANSGERHLLQEQFSVLPSSPAKRLKTIPAPFFLDSDSYQPISASSIPKAVVSDALVDLGSRADIHHICDKHFSGIHTWLPFLSPKGLYEKINQPGSSPDLQVTLLVLSMKLSAIPGRSSPSQENVASELYQTTKDLSLKMESSGLISLELLQSVILISIYELGHGLYPAAFLDVARAARLGILMGMHNREGVQLFKKPETWTPREEERRTWWALLILDRAINIGISGMPFATPDPAPHELLPCAEERWEAGLVGFNQPLLIDTVSTDVHIGSYANTCQSAHLLGLVIRHRDRKDHLQDRRSCLLEADQLHRTLLALSSHLRAKCSVAGDSTDKSYFTPLALCCSARFTLYEIYACNELYPKVADTGIAEEVAMQQTSLDGISSVLEDVCYIAQHILELFVVSGDEGSSHLSPLFCHCLYLAISECTWLFREERNEHRATQLKTLVESFQVLARVWNVVDDYVKILEAESSISLEQLRNPMALS